MQLALPSGARIGPTACFGLGATVGGFAAGALLHVVGGITGRPGAAVLATASLLAAVIDARRPRHLPELGFRVPPAWARLGGRGYVTAFGLVLGFGLVTAVPAAGLYALSLFSLAGETWAASIAPWIGFAAGRTATFGAARNRGACRGTNAAIRARAVVEKLRPAWTFESAILILLGLALAYLSVAG